MVESVDEKRDLLETAPLKLIALALVILVMLIATTLAITILVNFWDYDSSMSRNMRLLSATVIFRHGARAPNKLGANADADAFPNGKGQLTELGINDSFRLGRYLGARYVKTKFLRSPMSPSEILFLSRANSRCLATAALVGSGMWARDGDENYFTPVPIYSNVEKDELFTHLRDCNVDRGRLEEECNKAPPSQKNWEEYEGFIYECLGLHRGKSIIQDGKAYGEVDTLIQLDRHGMTIPEWFAQKKKEVYSLFQKMYSFIVGVNDYRSEKILRMKQGTFMRTIMSQIKNQWAEFEQTGKIRKKFTAYSTQDWLILAFLHSLGCGEAVLGETIPNYNALVIIELYLQDRKPVIKLSYKDNEMTAPMEAVQYVRNCKSSPCHLEEFTSCCTAYETDNPTETCDVEW